jgi:hypothetical protein
MASEGKSRRADTGSGNQAPKTRQPIVKRRAPAVSLDSEQRARLLLISGVVAVLLIAGSFLAFGYWYSEIRPEGRTVLQADNTKVSFSAMKRRMEYEYFSNVAFQQNPNVVAEATYLNLLNQLTLLNRAESELGVTATEDEQQQRLRSQLGVATDADDQTFATRYKSALDASGLEDSEYRDLVKAQVPKTSRPSRRRSR